MSEEQDSITAEAIPSPDNRGDLQKDTRFKPGQSGNPNGRPRGARSKLGDEFLQALAEDFYENGENVIKQVRMRDPTAYLKIVKDILPREAVIAAFDIKVGKDGNQGDFSDNTSIEGILDAVAREGGAESAQFLASMFNIEWSGQILEAEAVAPIDLETAKGYATRQRRT